jgi:putative protease
MTGRDSNRGACAQPCRYQYALMEEKRPGEYFPVYEDEKGTYILNSRDMCTIEHLQDLMDAGIDCIKIEGRAKSAYYAAIVTGAYRHCIDDLTAGRPMDPVWMDEVNHVSHRNYSTGFYYGFPGQYTENSRYIREWQIAAIVESCDENGLAQCSLRNKFSAGTELEIVGPDFRPMAFTVPMMEDMDGNPLEEPRTPEMQFKMQLPCPVPAFSILRKAVDLSAPIRVEAKIRYRHTPSAAWVTCMEDGGVSVVFDQPQRAVTPGQSVVFYEGDTVLGGGIIDPPQVNGKET